MIGSSGSHSLSRATSLAAALAATLVACSQTGAMRSQVGTPVSTATEAVSTEAASMEGADSAMLAQEGAAAVHTREGAPDGTPTVGHGAARSADAVPTDGPAPMLRTDPSAQHGVTRDEAEAAADAGEWTRGRLAELTLRQKVGQLVMARVSGAFTPAGSEEYEKARHAVEDLEVGGLLVAVGSPTEVAVKLNHLQGLSSVPLLVGADLENGAGFRFDGIVRLPGATDLGGATTLPSLMALGATGNTALAYRAGLVTGREARALGIHLPFAPVLDVNNNPENPIINIRSFGEDPAMVARMGVQFARGVQEAGAIATGKHFPGHGDTDNDSHVTLPVIRASRARLDSIELRPFREAIEDGIGSIMSAHIAMPEITGDARMPSTLSSTVLTGILREQLGFDGLIITDAMEMLAIDRRYGRGEAAVRALEAGADILLVPPDIDGAIDAVVRAVTSGRLAQERIDASVERVLLAKESLGLHQRRTVDIHSVHRAVGLPEYDALSDEIAEQSITLLRNEGDLIPLRGTRRARVLSVTYRRSSDLLAGRDFNATVRQTYPRLRTESVALDTDASIYARLAQQARQYDLVLVSTYVATATFAGRSTLSEHFVRFVEELKGSGVPHVVVSFGSPYLISEYPSVRAFMVAWSGADASQRAAANALFARRPIVGKTPARVPPYFDIGDGIQVRSRMGAR